MVELWVVWRYMMGPKGQGLSFVTILSILGMVIGIAALVLVMSVISGFETTLRGAVVDVMGDIYLFKRGSGIESVSELEDRIRKVVPETLSVSPFNHVEAMVAHKGKVGGVIVEGFESKSVVKTLGLHKRIVFGKFGLESGNEKIPPIIVGRSLADKLNIILGEIVNVVLPKTSPTAKVLGFVPRVKKFRVVGVVDLGMYQYDSRYMITSAAAAQELAGVGPNFSGMRISLKDHAVAPKASMDLFSELGANYIARDWLELNHNFFEALKLERVAIFVILLFMIVAACFNISSTLFVSVLRKFGDISILKTLGAQKKRLVRLFMFQGLMIGALGSLGGLCLGLGLCWAVSKFDIIYVPAEIYHLRRLPVEVNPLDLVAILVASFLLCLISTIAPALKGAKLNPIEGLRYD